MSHIVCNKVQCLSLVVRIWLALSSSVFSLFPVSFFHDIGCKTDDVDCFSYHIVFKAVC